jgi:3',5'-cyclic AMP phosphodiesterase CpdA
MDETLFGWIHISDIHFGHGDASHGWDQELVMGALRRDIAQRPAPVRVDAIFVTGDIAFSGAGRSPDEYQRARAWLIEAGKAAGVGPERIFLVPGNHDVNRNADAKSKSTGRLVRDLRSRATPAASLDDSLRDPEERKLLAGRMAAYLDFAKEFGPWAGRDPMPPAEERLYWVSSLKGRAGLLVRLVGLNTALLCKDDEDVGQLRLGKEQLAKGLASDRAPEEMILVLTHHPLRRGWLGDDGDADRYIRNNAQVHLSGHVHEAESEDARSGAGGSFVRVVAGAAHNEQLPAWIPATHGYSFGQIRGGPGGTPVLRVYPRLWSPAKTGFTIDVHGVPEDSVSVGKPFTEHAIAGVHLRGDVDGDDEHPAGGWPAGLPAPRVAPAAPAAPTPPAAAPPPARPRAPATGPLRVFLSYAPQDEALVRELEKHLTLLRRRGLIESFSSRSVGAGEGWRGVVDERLASADVILLLLSDDYVASDYHYDVEMETARRRYEAADAVVIPVWLRGLALSRLDAVGHEPLWFERLVRIPHAASGDGVRDGKPVTSWSDRDAAWTKVAEELRAKIEEMRRPA